MAAAAILDGSGEDPYAFVFGGRNPVAITLALAILGMVALGILDRREWIRPGPPSGRGAGLALALGAALAIPTIAVDLLGGFPAPINVPAPASLLFYPSIAFVAECAFHAIPLALVALVAGLISAEGHGARRIGIAAAALIEPALQVTWGNASAAWVAAFVGGYLFLFNVIGLNLLRRHGFAAAYLFRIGYYAIWHIAWGVARLHLLFGG